MDVRRAPFVVLFFFRCEPCSSGKKHGRIQDALEHLKESHIIDNCPSPARGGSSQDLSNRCFGFSRQNATIRPEGQVITQTEQWESEDDSSDENQMGPDNMFYVEELA